MQKWPFKIQYIDTNGNGVSKLDDNLTLIPKTLANESGTYIKIKENKKLNFGKVYNIENKSEDRIKPSCEFYQNCTGCHFQHMNYQKELELKQNNFAALLPKDFSAKEIHLVYSPENRFSYRNRVQLHYDQTAGVLGFKHSVTHKITPVTQCLLASTLIQDKITSLIINQIWRDLIPNNEPNKGHIELYEVNNKVNIHWNKTYAADGFSQVNTKVNSKVKEIIKDLNSSFAFKNSLELFAGDGNLTNHLKLKKRICLDFYNHPKKDYFNINLYKKDALTTFRQSHYDKVNTLILDPPRKGFADLKLWVEHFSPQNILYMSCNHQSMLQDLQFIAGYKIQKVYLIDFFPNTYHFESLIFMTKEK